MSNIFANKKTAKNESKVEEDFIGGGGAVETDIYKGTIKYAYIGKAANSEARNLSISVVLADSKKEITNQIWMTNREGNVTYKDKSGEEKNLPGFNQVNSICMLLASKEVGNMEVEEKTLSLYDFESKKEIPQQVDCFVDLHGVEVSVAIQKQTVDKTEKNDAGEYVPTGDTRDVNEMIKFFPADKLFTLSEIAHFIESVGADLDEVLEENQMDKVIAKMEGDSGQYAVAWLEKNRGQTYDRTTKKGKGKEFKASSSGGEKKKKSSLFDD